MIYGVLLILIVFLYVYFHFSKRIPILMYHRIATVRGDRNSLPKEKFEEQLKYIFEQGYHSITIEQLEAHLLHNKELPEKPIVLTFDDAYQDNLTTAMPLLEKYHQLGNVFSIANWQGKENRWENFGKEITKTMDKEELLQWQNQGHYVGSHTMDHPFLSDCHEERLQHELADSKIATENITGKKVTCICYPYGNFNGKVLEEAKKCGYNLGLGIFDHVPLWTIDVMALPRIPVPSHQKMWEFKLKISSIHMLFVFLRRVERCFKRMVRK